MLCKSPAIYEHNTTVKFKGGIDSMEGISDIKIIGIAAVWTRIYM